MITESLAHSIADSLVHIRRYPTHNDGRAVWEVRFGMAGCEYELLYDNPTAAEGVCQAIHQAIVDGIRQSHEIVLDE